MEESIKLIIKAKGESMYCEGCDFEGSSDCEMPIKLRKILDKNGISDCHKNGCIYVIEEEK